MVFCRVVGARLLSRGRPLALWSTLGLAALGCSLLYDLESGQCTTDADCANKGPLFADTECVASLCVSPTATGGSGGGGGMGDAGSDGADCVEHMDCVNEYFGERYICRAGSCVPLTLSTECPVVLGLGKDNENLKKPDPIIVGAYSRVNPTAPRVSAPTLNYELAINEVNETGGLSGGSGGTRRPFIAVVCSGTDSPNLEASLGHLIDDLGVPAIISSLYTKDLLEAFETKGLPNNVFFLSPLEADSRLSNLEDNGLLWHMLTSALDLAPAYLPLLARAEELVATQLGLEEGEEIRVALVESRTPFLKDIAEYLVREGQFNGKSFTDNDADGNLRRVIIDSAIEEPSPETSEAFAAALAAVQSFEPHIVLAAASSEFVHFMNGLEAGRPPEAPEPLYLASPFLFGISGFATGAPPDRTLGVNFAGATDTSLYDEYLLRLKATYNTPGLVLDGSENFYDAAYFLMYSIAAAGNPPRLTGREVALGMTRLLDGQLEFRVGENVAGAIDTLEKTSLSISLHGTMGPPDFHTSTGVRRGLPSIYCIDDGSFVQDAMTYNPDSEQLEGEPCIPGF